jgi:hypothetical protein
MRNSSINFTSDNKIKRDRAKRKPNSSCKGKELRNKKRSARNASSKTFT